MATNNKKATSPKSVKPNSGVKNAMPAKSAVKTPAKPAKKTIVKPEHKNAQPKKSGVPAKKTPAKPVVKSAPAKKTTPAKAIPTKNIKTNNNQKTVNKNNSKSTTPAKKATPPKKEAPKKAAPVAKKTAPAKPTHPPVAKPVAKTPAKSIVKHEPVAKAEVTEKPPVAKKPQAKKKVTLTQMPVKVNPAAPRPMATPVARSTEKKPNIVIAHRRLENKSKGPKEVENTMIHYQPETYRSILDEPEQQQGTIYRYSDEDLNEFRDIITSRLEAARKELLYLHGLITRRDEAGTEDTENRYMNMEDGSGAMEREQLAQLASRQIQFINHLEKALVRIENKTYGICRVTGKLIDKARLRAVPHATLSIEAKNTMTSKQN